MHAVLITYQATAAHDAPSDQCVERAGTLQAVPGLVMKTWLRDGDTLGGFYLFATREAADEYLASDLAEASPAPAVRHFAVCDELSQATGTPQPLGM